MASPSTPSSTGVAPRQLEAVPIVEPTVPTPPVGVVKEVRTSVNVETSKKKKEVAVVIRYQDYYLEENSTAEEDRE